MRSNRWLTAGALVSAIAGLAASIASLVDDLRARAQFCAESGCATVHASWWAKPFGIPMSLLGVVFFTAMAALAFIPRPRLRLYAALAGAAWAVFLIGLQAFEIGAWCKLCMVADPAAILHAACVIGGAGVVALEWRRIAASTAGVAALVIALGAVWGRSGPPPLPDDTPASVVREQVPDQVTIVEFLDFECPFCRKVQYALEEALAATPHKVRVVRKMLPFPDHPHAFGAAVMWCCADLQGKGEEMARELFRTPVEMLTKPTMEAIAKKIGCDMTRFEKDLEAGFNRVKADVQDAIDGGIHALPTLYVGGAPIVGSATTDELLAAIDRAAP
ncbi:MAG: thioredoxin domain-containing protein [Deltaproteobacteria bacterium]|nr:thioredoxin domain-containing protein [Deltaproteobacteria bacterium]